MGNCFCTPKPVAGPALVPNNNQIQNQNADDSSQESNASVELLAPIAHPLGAPGDPAAHPNRPLVALPEGYHCKLPDPYSQPTSTSSHNPGSVPWTRQKLELERNAWWETHSTTGDPEKWATYKQIINHLQGGRVQEAQTLLDAAGCTCPNGKAWHAIYDERGFRYAIRDARASKEMDWVVFEPKGLADDDEVVQGEREEEAVQVEGKGKGRAVVQADDDELGEVVQMRCRVSPNGEDYLIAVREGDKVGVIKTALSAEIGIPVSRIRVSYGGRLHESHEKLHGWIKGNALTIMVAADYEPPASDFTFAERIGAITDPSSDTLVTGSRGSGVLDQTPRIPTPAQALPLSPPEPKAQGPSNDQEAITPATDQQAHLPPTGQQAPLPPTGHQAPLPTDDAQSATPPNEPPGPPQTSPSSDHH
ncbi:uncharacterized protein EI97DRAFT_430551 [Westerdykella ornata]|uniref:Ubiquitin-like domain-containing protein n=1 Tax=Westerdykella ornata TaxID=318751 RepID=A0A6A6JT95_WESOR|nr:uncharacterized protein EI97DRAFT_430551 [Westerdykella ornata]KAF2279485.1 hypothetical protein EI97DRAFT_430551 [Westerdykella ornata]